MIRTRLLLVLCWCLLTIPASAADPGELFEEAENLSRGNQKDEAMAKCEQAVKEIDRAFAAGESISWQGRNGLRMAAQLARQDFLDFEKAMSFSNKLMEIADTDYWMVPARLERALTYRAMGEYDNAQKEYDAIAESDERQRTSAFMPQAEMVYFDMGDEQRGRSRIVNALMNEQINGRERFNMLRKCAQAALDQGDRDKAIAWYAMLPKLPFDKADERARFLSQAWYEQGRIEESRGRTAEAKQLYRNAMQLEEGEMRYRARSRDALEFIEYFE